LALSRNKPVEFESQVLHMYFDRRHPKVMRVMDSTYAGTTCLRCRGGQGGTRYHRHKKEGREKGELAGAIGLTMPLR